MQQYQIYHWICNGMMERCSNTKYIIVWVMAWWRDAATPNISLVLFALFLDIQVAVLVGVPFIIIFYYFIFYFFGNIIGYVMARWRDAATPNISLDMYWHDGEIQQHQIYHWICNGLMERCSNTKYIIGYVMVWWRDTATPNISLYM